MKTNISELGGKELLDRIYRREEEEPFADVIRCDWCGAVIEHGKYYMIGFETVCGDCVEQCERFV